MRTKTDKRKQRTQLYLEASSGEIKQRPFLTFDVESKHEDTQKCGLSRPFMVGVYNGREFRVFRNDPITKRLPWEERATSNGGCIDKFMRFVLGEQGRFYQNRYRDHDMYAHNMGGFDGLFILPWLARNKISQRYSFELIPVQSKIMSMEIWRHRQNHSRITEADRARADRKDKKTFGSLRILDSFKIMPISLDAMIKMFKLRPEGAGKVKFDLNTHEDDPSWDEYNRVDTVELWNVMKRYQELIMSLGGSIGPTAPSTAMRLLRAAYLGDRVIHRHRHFKYCEEHHEYEHPEGEKKAKMTEPCPGCAHEFFRHAYHGGRTEIFTDRGENLTYYDINSSYPASMKERMPIGEMTELHENQDFTSYAAGVKYVGFVACTVWVPETEYFPPLPLEMGGKLKFPVGVFSGIWDYVELRALLEIGGRILHVDRSVWIEADHFMADFVDRLYAMRDKKLPDYDVGRAEVAKIMLNSTFGKFGMARQRQQVVVLKPGESEPYCIRRPKESRTAFEKRRKATELKPIDDITISMDYMTSRIRVRDVEIDYSYMIPQIAAHITALSRMRLWRFTRHVLEQTVNGKPAKIFYMDTDSLITDWDGYPDETHLGGIKKEFGPWKIDYHAYGPKMYLIGMSDPKAPPFKGQHERDAAGKRICKDDCGGCSRKKVMAKGVPKNLKTEETLELLVAGGLLEFTQLEKLGRMMRQDFHKTPKMIPVKKSIKSKYDKRMLYSGTGNTAPLVVSEWRYRSQSLRRLISTPHDPLRREDVLAEYTPPTWLETLAERA